MFVSTNGKLVSSSINSVIVDCLIKLVSSSIDSVTVDCLSLGMPSTADFYPLLRYLALCMMLLCRLVKSFGHIHCSVLSYNFFVLHLLNKHNSFSPATKTKFKMINSVRTCFFSPQSNINHISVYTKCNINPNYSVP